MSLDKLFLSYARADDLGFVNRLYDDLTRLGYAVWWDKMSMPSRALQFLQEIRDAIEESDRLILVVGLHALESTYVRAEWEYALSICRVVTPILRSGSMNNFLSHWLVFTASISENHGCMTMLFRS